MTDTNLHPLLQEHLDAYRLAKEELRTALRDLQQSCPHDLVTEATCNIASWKVVRICEQCRREEHSSSAAGSRLERHTDPETQRLIQSPYPTKPQLTTERPRRGDSAHDVYKLRMPV